ncbi:MAG: DUF3971 domain-containing protein [Alphaproteobacteria bacterium]|nr:MAG: DUF3971 domain-containing protein [Alphaproteobacteria bacterium]
MIKRSSKLLIEITGVVLAGITLIAVALGLRLMMGPIDLDYLNPYIVSGLVDKDAPMRLQIEHTQMEWDGDHQSVVLRLQSLQAFDANNQPMATLPDLAIGISVPSLLIGKIAPSRIVLIQPSLTVIRYADGHIGLSDMRNANAAVEETPKDNQNILAEEILDSLTGKDNGHPALTALRRVEIREGEILFDDQKNEVSLWAPKVNLKLVRNRKGIFGRAELQLEMNEKISQFKTDIAWPAGGDDISVKSQFENIDFANIAALLPEMRDFAFLKTPISGELNVNGTRSGVIQSISFKAKGTGGQIEKSDFFAKDVPVQGINLDAQYDQQGNLHINAADFNFGTMKANVSGDVIKTADQYQMHIKSEIHNLDIKDLDMYWPQIVAKDARDWVVPNVQQGQVSIAKAEFKGHAPKDNPAQLTTDEVKGEIHFADATVDYFHPLPVATGVDGVATFDADNFWVKTTSGAVQKINLGAGDVTIRGLSQHDQDIDIKIAASGDLTTAIQIVDHEPLKLPSKRDIKADSIRGDFTADLSFKFPLLKDLQLEQLAIAVNGNLQKVYYNNAFWGFPLSRGQMKIAITQSDMEISGDAYLAGLPMGLVWKEDFRDKPKNVRSQYLVSAALPDIGIDILDLPKPLPISGIADVELDYAVLNKQDSRLSLKANLQKTAIAVPQANWWKETGTPATGKIDMILANNELRQISNFGLAAKDVKIDGTAEFNAGNILSRLEVKQLQTPGNNAQVIMKREKEKSYVVNLWGNRFDMAHIYRARDEEKDDTIYTIDINLANLSLGGLQDFMQVKSRKIVKNGEFESMRFNAVTQNQKENPVPAEIIILPDPSGRRLTVKSDDAGSFLRAADIYDSMHGGKISIEGAYDDKKKDPILNGRVLITNFSVKDAPILAKLLNLSSLPGILQNLSGEGIGFEKLAADFKLQNDLVSVKKARVSGSSIGLKADGNIDLNRGLFDLDGVLIPANSINKIISDIPLVGTILTAGGEQPLFAFTYSIKGPTGAPRVSVNPLSALTPGILREVFEN